MAGTQTCWKKWMDHLCRSCNQSSDHRNHFHFCTSIRYATTASDRLIRETIVNPIVALTVRSASLILLQGTPSHVNLGRVQKSLEAIPGVLQVHGNFSLSILFFLAHVSPLWPLRTNQYNPITELHIWSLSESKLVASVHVLIKNQHDFVLISRHIRKRLHQFGIHSR